MKKLRELYRCTRCARSLMLVVCSLAGCIASGVLASESPVARKAVYPAPDRQVWAVVVYYRSVSYGIGESRVDILTRKGRKVASQDYQGGGTQGYRVEKTWWTADSRFFIYSTESAGGHSPWHHPTHFYDWRTRRFYLVDALNEKGPKAVNDPDFTLRPPATLKVSFHPWEDRQATFDLRRLSARQRRASLREEQDEIRRRQG